MKKGDKVKAMVKGNMEIFSITKVGRKYIYCISAYLPHALWYFLKSSEQKIIMRKREA
ncbi:hypothetical protein [Nostoc sp.]|uniref:hypothetical protein n=1 Tax=Nostoc sp. TaxID=1180 RepID=UPI002FF5DFD0